jgi:DNA-binding NarL/FixJ family response regulator
MIRIVLVENHEVVRQGLRALLEREADMIVMGEAGVGEDVLPLVEQHAPDVLVLDWMLPGMHGLEVVRRLRKAQVRARIVVLSMHSDESYVLSALREGASAYVLKEAGAEQLVHAIREAIAGRRYLSPPLSEDALESYRQRKATGELDPLKVLTDRERQVLQLVAEGRTNAEIAARLTISQRTAESHRANMMRKLNLEHQADVTRYAIRRGIIALE